MNSRPILFCGAVICLSLLVITSSILLVSFNVWFYKMEFALYGVHNSFPDQDIMNVNEHVLSFLKGQQDSLPNIFNEREKAHFEDVRSIFSFIKYLLLFSLAFTIIYFWQLWKKEKKSFSNHTSLLLQKSGITVCLIIGIAVLLVLLNFSSSFDIFHQIFFKEGTYSFDPTTENIVVLYPEALFRDAALLIGGFSLLVALFFLRINTYATKNKKLFKKVEAKKAK